MNQFGLTWMLGGGVVDKNKDLYSWTDASVMMANPKMSLYDDRGNLIYGLPRFNCSNSTTAPKNEGSSGVVSINKEKYIFTVWEDEDLVDFTYKEKDENGQEKNVVVKNGKLNVTLKVKNVGIIDAEGPLYVKYFVTHPDGQVPLLTVDGKDLSIANVEMDVNGWLSVKRNSVGDRHVFVFTLKNGLKKNNEVSIDFELNDNCITCVYKEEAESFFSWDVMDDWSRVPDFEKNSGSGTVENVVVLTKDFVIRYGVPDPYAPNYKVVYGEGTGPVVEIPDIEVQELFPNRTDAVSYSGGQLLTNGGFEEPSLIGWNLMKGSAISVRGETVQGSRSLKLSGEICQEMPEAALNILSDSASVLSFWHKGGSLTVKIGKLAYSINESAKWSHSLVFNANNLLTDKDANKVCFESNSDVSIDNVALVPNTFEQPTTYAVRFTTTLHDEIESRVYDGENKLLVTSSARDSMGRPMYKYLPFEHLCSDEKDCNSAIYTQEYSDMAKEFYSKDNPFYPDAQGFPYVETKWKPDPAVTKDVEGAPGKAFSLDADSKTHHVVRSFSSGVNLTGINMKDSSSLASAVNAVRNCRVFADGECKLDGSSDDGDYNFHAAKDDHPTHTWELNVDPNGNAAFTVKDGEGRVIVSGAMKKISLSKDGEVAYELLTRSVNELDARGNVIKSHLPMSCEYSPKPASCVNPSTYGYDAQSRLVWSKEPDAGETRTYYDLVGRVRATQTQRQIDSGWVAVVGYDHLDRVIYSGMWKTSLDEDGLRSYFANVDNKDKPTVDELTLGTVTRTIYDRVPASDTLGVRLFVSFASAPDSKYARGRVSAVISDVAAVKSYDGSTLKAADGTDSVVRVATSYSYDKYGRVLNTYAYDPTMSANSLKTLWSTNEYDLGGKAVAKRNCPYGYSMACYMNRDITERYHYDRLGRIDRVLARRDDSEYLVASYEYYPTGAVKTVNMGNSLTLTYTYHISGAVKSATVKSAKGEKLYSETLHYEDCGDGKCTPQYNGNISRMVHQMADAGYVSDVDMAYTYDALNRLVKADGQADGLTLFDEEFDYDVQGRIVEQRRGGNADGGKYKYKESTNKLQSVDGYISGYADGRDMSDPENFVYDQEGNLVEDKSKNMKISYDWRGMPVEFVWKDECYNYKGHFMCDSAKLVLAYDGSGRRISKTRMNRKVGNYWWPELRTHYTGVGTEVRENFFSYGGEVMETKVVVNMPNGLGRYGVEDAENLPGFNAPLNFEWYLKNHLGSTMLVYGTQASTDPNKADVGEAKAKYYYRSFGEQLTGMESPDKVTENFTGKELDDETWLNYFGARYLDPMLGLWISVDPKRQFASPYLYAGNGMNPVNTIDPDGNYMWGYLDDLNNEAVKASYWGSKTLKRAFENMEASDQVYHGVAGNYANRGKDSFYGHKEISIYDDANYEVYIHTPGRSIKQQACTAAHEYFEDTSEKLNGEVINYTPQNWHRDPTKGLDAMFKYYNNYDDFLEANYKGTLTDGKNHYESDNVYKREYECLNEK